MPGVRSTQGPGASSGSTSVGDRWSDGDRSRGRAGDLSGMQGDGPVGRNRRLVATDPHASGRVPPLGSRPSANYFPLKK
jgi:hypothetical protein